MGKKMLSILFVGAVIGLFVAQTTIAFDPNWKEKQDKGFEAVGLKPGDVINAENWQKVQNSLPFSVVEWVKKGEFTIKVGELKYDYSPDERYETYSLETNKGKYKIGGRDQIVEAASGKDPEYVGGRPFPVVDEKNDPQAGLKIMHNNSLDKMRPGSYFCNFDVCWISDTGGLDRYLYGDDLFFYHWNRPDRTPLPNQQKVRRYGMTVIQEPFDLAGAAMLYHYWLDGSPERFVQYIPALRRIKKMNVTDRSSPFFGTDFCNDDGGGYVGQPEAMTWKIIERKIFLIPIAEWNLDNPEPFEELPEGGWRGTYPGKLKWGYEDQFKNEKYNVSWMPWFVKWVPRECWRISMKAKDPYYAYGDQELIVDIGTYGIVYKIVWDKSGAYWKTLVVSNCPANWGENLSFSSQNFYLNVDDKTHHASACNARGVRGKYNFNTYLNWTKNQERNYRDEYISTAGR